LRCGASNIIINTINPPRSRFIHANHNIEIEPLGKEIVEIKTDEIYDVALITQAGKSIVQESEVQSKEQYIPVFLMNPTHIIEKIRKGDIIATISPVQIISE